MGKGTYGVPTVRNDSENQELTRRCLELRLSGGTLDSIGATVGLHKSNVSRRIQQALSEIPAAEATELRQIENERLDVMLLSIWKRVRQGDLGSIDRALRISERRSRLNGLDAPQQVDVGVGHVNITATAQKILDELTDGDPDTIDGEAEEVD